MSLEALQRNDIVTTEDELFSQLQCRWSGTEWELHCEVSAPIGFEIDLKALSLFKSTAYQGFDFAYIPQEGIDSLLPDGTKIDKLSGRVQIENTEDQNHISVTGKFFLFYSAENEEGMILRSLEITLLNPPIDIEKKPEGNFDQTTGVIQAIFWNSIPFSSISN